MKNANKIPIVIHTSLVLTLGISLEVRQLLRKSKTDFEKQFLIS